MFQVDLKNRKPIYEQVVDNFKRLIIAGSLKEAEKVPSIRDMAKSLAVNPNTVQKAYRELEGQGFIYTVLGQGSFIAAPPQAVASEAVAALYEALAHHVRELIFKGEVPEKIQRFVSDIVQGGDSNGAS